MAECHVSRWPLALTLPSVFLSRWGGFGVSVKSLKVNSTFTFVMWL